MDAQEILGKSTQLVREGYVVLNGLYPPSCIEQSRQCVLENLALLKNTRPNPSSGHLAGFHRYAAFQPLHRLLSTNSIIAGVLRAAVGSPSLRPIGLSDITVNRSQEWHVDLLRGRYRHHLDADICWGNEGGGLYKALLYLQEGNSLKIRSGVHTEPIELDSDEKSRPTDPSQVTSVRARAGDVILMDIRLPHRGSSEAELDKRDYASSPKILVSTVLGGDCKALTTAMEIGNLERLTDWDMLHKDDAAPRLALTH